MFRKGISSCHLQPVYRGCGAVICSFGRSNFPWITRASWQIIHSTIEVERQLEDCGKNPSPLHVLDLYWICMDFAVQFAVCLFWFGRAPYTSLFVQICFYMIINMRSYVCMQYYLYNHICTHTHTYIYIYIIYHISYIYIIYIHKHNITCTYINIYHMCIYCIYLLIIIAT